jgi:hypothetical protein
MVSSCAKFCYLTPSFPLAAAKLRVYYCRSPLDVFHSAKIILKNLGISQRFICMQNIGTS